VFGFIWLERITSHKHKVLGEIKRSLYQHKIGSRDESFSYKYKAIKEWISRSILGKVWVRFILCLLIIVLAWLPAYLAYYPAICSYDFTIQLGQIISGAYNEHHPLLHTLLIKGFMSLGTALFHNANAGIAMFALLQFILLAALFSGGICMLKAAGVKWYFNMVLLLYSMFFPVHWYMGLSIVKDTVFTIFVAGFFLLYYALLHLRKNSLRLTVWDIGYLFAVIGMVLFRNNGKYALFVLLFVQLLTLIIGKKYRKFYGRMLCVTLLGLLLGSGTLRLVFQTTGAVQGDVREMFSVPIQQISRVMLYHEDELSQKDKALINDYISNEAYRNYRPEIADPVKGHTISRVVRYRPKEFLDTYLSLFRKYPGGYLNAGLALNAGYLWMGDTSHATINQKTSDDRGLGYIQTRWLNDALQEAGLFRMSKWPQLLQQLEDFANNNAYLSNPILRYLVVPGTYLWAYLLMAGIWIIRRRFVFLLPLAFALGYYITLLLGPAVQLRYLYPLMICLPFLTIFCIGIRDKPQAA
jgi:hypothetical protein